MDTGIIKIFDSLYVIVKDELLYIRFVDFYMGEGGGLNFYMVIVIFLLDRVEVVGERPMSDGFESG